MPEVATQETTQTIVQPAKVLPFMIGADPEFLLFHGKRGIDASHVLRAFFHNKTNVQEGGAGYMINQIGEFGWDGASSTGELRPEPTNDPKILTDRIGTLIKEMYKELPFLDFTTLSIGSPIGGHVHLDLPESYIGREFFASGYGSSTETERRKSKTTKLVATFMMPIIASEHRISSTSRMATNNYGRADDIRYEVKGSASGRRFATAEVRGMSAEWITCPKITYATLCYLGVVWNEILKRSDELIKDKIVLKTKNHINTIQQMMLADFKPVERGITSSIGKLVRQFELYPLFKDEVELILHPKEAMHEKEKYGWNMEGGWIQNKVKVPTKKDLLSDKKVSEGVRSDKTLIENTVGIPHNEDYKVKDFAQAISERIAVFNWKLQNNYFLFGLKKEIKGFAVMNQQNNKFFSIPSNNDKAKTIDSCLKMAQRFTQFAGNGVKIDPKTGKTTTKKSNAIIIGIPYDIRADNNTKTLIELIWSIEKGKIKEKTIDEFDAPVCAKRAQKDTQEVIEKCLRSNDCTINNLSAQDVDEILDGEIIA